MRYRTLSLFGSVGFAALVFGASSAMAQRSAAPAQSAPATSDAQASQTATSQAPALPEIVVTAQRREERLQNVPVTVEAVSGASALKQGVTHTLDLSTAVPGLEISHETGGAAPFIRGVGSNFTVAGAEASVATYVDGVYISSVQGALFQLNNISRIEVEKGPQGTLFGRNATGGVIQIITKDPSSTPSADVSVGYANYDTSTGTFYGTTGLLPNLAGDLSVYADNRAAGWGRNLYDGSATYTERDIAVRTKLLWTPTGATQVRLTLGLDSPRTEEGLGYKVLPGTEAVGGSGYPGFYNTDANVDDHLHNHSSFASLSVTQDLGFGILKSISSYQTNDYFYYLDFDGGPTNAAKALVRNTDDAATQEIQLASPKSSKIQWIGGFFYYHDIAGYVPLILTGTDVAPLPVQLYARQFSDAYAGYAQTTFEVIKDTHFTAGLRYTEDERSINGTTTLVGVGQIAAAIQAKNFGKLTWRFALDHQFTPDILGYVSYNRGFKSGTFNTTSYASPAVNPEILDAYEIGLKSEYLDHRLRVNLAGYYYDDKNLQVDELVDGAALLINAASARIYGLDADVSAAVTRRLTITGSLSLLHGTYTSFPGAPLYQSAPGGGNLPPTSIDASGLDIEHAPHVTGNITADYKRPTAIGDFDISGTVYYSAKQFEDVADQIPNPAYTLINTSIGWTEPSHRYGIRIWAENLENAAYYESAVPTAYASYFSPAAPRTYGFTVSAHF